MLSNFCKMVSEVLIFVAIQENVFWCMKCWCLSVTGTCVADILFHSAEIGLEITMTKSELCDCCNTERNYSIERVCSHPTQNKDSVGINQSETL